MKLSKHQNEADLFSTRRVENLTDGVFAIAMTVLVLDLKIPYGAVIHDQSQLLQYFSENTGLFRNFLISFLILAGFWAVHMRQFERVTKVDRHATMVNSARLLFVVLIPFTASVAGNYPEIPLARELMALNFLLIAAVSLWQWYYISRNPQFTPELTEDDRKYGLRRNSSFVVVAALICILVIPFGEYAYFLYFLVPILMYFFTRSLRIKHQN
jgi:uncharacterized membrane protein